MDNHEQNFYALHQYDSAAACAYITQHDLYTYSLLQWACSNEHDDIAELLVANYLTNNSTIFIEAIEKGDIKVAKWLIKKISNRCKCR